MGAGLEKLIKEEGFLSPYDFWLQSDVGISRGTLNYVLRGEVDVKATTLKKIANALGYELDELFKKLSV